MAKRSKNKTRRIKGGTILDTISSWFKTSPMPAQTVQREPIEKPLTPNTPETSPVKTPGVFERFFGTTTGTGTTTTGTGTTTTGTGTTTTTGKTTDKTNYNTKGGQEKMFGGKTRKNRKKKERK